MSWNYRIVKEKQKDLNNFPDGFSYSIYEIYYDKKYKVVNWFKLDVLSNYSSIEELKNELSYIINSFEKSILEKKEDNIK